MEQQAANNNLFVLDANDNKKCLPKGWDKYEKVSMTRFGPIGSRGGSFVYLDPRTVEERG